MDTDWTNEEEHAEWLEKWAPDCPIGFDQRVCRCLAYREREPGRLQLRVAVRPGKEGICEVVVDEMDDSVLVRVFVCYPPDTDYQKNDEWLNCPVHVYLDNPLNHRKVIDVQTGEALPIFVPDW